MVTIEANALQNFVGDIFAKAGCSAEESRRIGKYLVAAMFVGFEKLGLTVKDETHIVEEAPKAAEEKPE